MIDVANGYFETLQLNDGTLRTQFTDDCNRREDGMQSTNNPHAALDPDCGSSAVTAQFQLGQYRYDDRLRDRRFLAVDEERGIVLAGGFIDHEGRLGEFTLTDGSRRERRSSAGRIHSCCSKHSRSRGGRIQQVEAVFTDRAVQHAVAVANPGAMTWQRQRRRRSRNGNIPVPRAAASSAPCTGARRAPCAVARTVAAGR